MEFDQEKVNNATKAWILAHSDLSSEELFRAAVAILMSLCIAMKVPFDLLVETLRGIYEGANPEWFIPKKQAE